MKNVGFFIMISSLSWSASAANCDLMTADIVQRTGAAFDHYSPSGQNIFFTYTDIEDFILTCGPTPSLISVSGAWNRNAFPSNGFFKEMSLAGTVVASDSATKIEVALRQCYKAALADKSELSELNTNGAHVECQAFKRDGGGVSESVFQK